MVYDQKGVPGHMDCRNHLSKSCFPTSNIGDEKNGKKREKKLSKMVPKIDFF